MIKQIQLRGISHSPSDRLNADGGLEDCIDLRMIEQEQAPVTPPENVSETLAPGLSSSGIDVLYIHKTNTYTNYVGKKIYTVGSSVTPYLVAYVYHKNGLVWEWATVQIRLIYDEVESITSVGNMLVYSLSDGKTYYALYDGSEYKDLGSSIPRPTVTFATEFQSSVSEIDGEGVNGLVSAYNAQAGQDPTTKQLWDFVRERKNDDDAVGQMASHLYENVYQFVWDTANKWRKDSQESDIFTAPLLARYAVKMYDGNYIYLSEPILLSGGEESYTDTIANICVLSSDNYLVTMMGADSRFKATVNIDYTIDSAWEDLIESVDIFLSTDILCPKLNSSLLYAKELNSSTVISPYTQYGVNTSKDIIFMSTPDWEMDFESAMLEQTNFYKVASFPVSSLPSSPSYLKCYTQDELVVKERLEEVDPHFMSAVGSLGSYNNMLVSGEQKVVLSPGHSEPQALLPGATGSSADYEVFYYVKDANGQTRIVKGYDDSFLIDEVAAYIAYPDAKCFRAEIYVKAGGYTTVHHLDMKEHPRLNVAYGYWGLGNKFDLTEIPSGNYDGWYSDKDVSSHIIPPMLSPSYTVNNRLALTEMDNPFVFPLGMRARFASRILEAVPVTTALSTGQFGQFPLYVFTEDGIWAVPITDEGRIASTHPVSRDVAVEGTVTQLDQSVLFVSSQGVMMISGSQIVCLSPNMPGPQYTIADIAPAGSELWAALNHDGWGPLLDIHMDTTDFQDFVEGCKPIYDYANKRILFFNVNEDYGYDYALDTQTWSKVSVPTFFERRLNGYPDALGVFGGEIFNWSVRPVYNDADPPSRKGFLVTRPFDLGEPDVRKAIKSLRIRGYFNHKDVKYMLLGSMNGIVWRKLLSLRGGSYKSFRLVILANLAPGERISWVDVDYEGRFGDKLR